MSNMILIECSACEAVVAAETLAQYTAVLNPKLGATERVTFARCRKCESPLLVGEEFYGSEDGRRQWSDPYRLYPARDDVLAPRIPRVVRSLREEAHGCFKAQAFSAATMMCCRTLEAAFVDHNVQYETIAGGLAEMRGQGMIDSRLFEWSEALPQLARRSEPDTSRDDARNVIEFTEALLSYLYRVRNRFQDFRARQNNRSHEPRPLSSEPTLAAVAAGAASPPPNGERPT